MEEEIDYEAVASTTEIVDITSCEINRMILHRLKRNIHMGPEFNKLCIRDHDIISHTRYRTYIPKDGEGDLGWLGYFLGENKTLQELHLTCTDTNNFPDILPFCKGLGSNEWIRKMIFEGFDLMDGQVFPLLNKFVVNLHTLSLSGSNIDDESIEVLTHALSEGQVQELCIKNNPFITAHGWKELSTLLEMPDSNLEKLIISSNNIRPIIFANALRGNRKLKKLYLYGRSFVKSEWACFSNLLCDTSSVNNTYLSNHTLRVLVVSGREFPDDVKFFLELNKHFAKGQIAMRKILLHHSEFNVQPFFEWELKVLPLLISWFAKTKSFDNTLEEDELNRRKLSSIYDFVREMPMLYIDPCTKQGIGQSSCCTIL